MGIGVFRSSRDILIGDPLAEHCAGNSVTRGSISVSQNSTDVEFVIRGNTVQSGSLYVVDNGGSSSKLVQNNKSGRRLTCTGNSGSFLGTSNRGFQSYTGQCAT
jgi:hypothetical protein